VLIDCLQADLPTASELEDREEAMVDVEARMPTPALDASASGELNTLSISDRLRVALLLRCE